MPYPLKVEYNALIEKVRQLIETDGLEHLSLQRVADEFGVKAPSLYKHISSKNALLLAVAHYATECLIDVVKKAGQNATGGTRERLIVMMNAYRKFAHENPRVYSLAFNNISPDIRPAPEYLEALAAPFQPEFLAIAGKENSQSALRGAWALVHGFITLELNDQFLRGGNLDTNFHHAISAYVDGLQKHNT